MENKFTLQDLLKLYNCDSIESLAKYIDFLETEVEGYMMELLIAKEEHEHMKYKFKCLINDIKSSIDSWEGNYD